MKRSGLLIALVACSSGPTEPPSPTPPPPWGVPISGGTMLVTRDDTRAIVADPDRDRVMIVDLATGDTTAEIALDAGSDPGRIVEDSAGRVHVALRGARSLLTLDATTGEVRSQRLACNEPRGLAWDPATDLVHVACTSGELVSFPAGDGNAVRSIMLDRDLRDVVVRGTQLVVTRFRTAEMITLDAQGAVVSRVTPPTVMRISGGDAIPLSTGEGSGSGSGSGSGFDPATPEVAWRTIALPDGRLAMTHQRKAGQILSPTPGGYGGSCGGHGIVESAITITDAAGTPVAIAPFVQGALPVDIAVDAQGTRLAFASAGSNTISIVPMSATGQHDDDMCGDSDRSQVFTADDQLGAPTSVAFRANGELVTFYPELPALVVRPANAPGSARTITLPGNVGYDAGRAVFHAQTQANIACASCHPEARDDGQVWNFNMLGLRRTQNLAGGILSRGPYHWAGDMTNLQVLMSDVFAQRMAGGALTNSQLVSLGPWLDRVPAPQGSATDAAAVTRGQQLFMSQELGCTTCHVGPLYTNNMIVNVGTGGSFKVPSLLGVGLRAPFMHDGCAPTLGDRFGTCGGGDLHGKTSMLTPEQVNDLVAFLESL